MDGQAEPAFTIRALGLPVAAIRVVGFEVAVGNRFVCIFKAHHLNFQALLSDPCFALVVVTLFEVRHVGVLEHSVFVPPHQSVIYQADSIQALNLCQE